MRTTLRKNVVLALVFIVIVCTGCYQYATGTDPMQGEMPTQSGQQVEVYRDIWGREYYYENGAKVYVNETGGTATDDRPTRWQNDPNAPASNESSDRTGSGATGDTGGRWWEQQSNTNARNGNPWWQQ